MSPYRMGTQRGNRRVQSVIDKAMGNIIVGDEKSAINVATGLRSSLEKLAATKTFHPVLQPDVLGTISTAVQHQIKSHGFPTRVVSQCINIVEGKKK